MEYRISISFYDFNEVKIVSLRVGEMSQELREPAALAEDPGFNSRYPHGNTQPSVTLVPGSNTLTRHTIGQTPMHRK